MKPAARATMPAAVTAAQGAILRVVPTAPFRPDRTTARPCQLNTAGHWPAALRR